MARLKLAFDSKVSCLLLMLLLPSVARAAEGTLEIRIVDAAGDLTSARAWVDSGEQRWFHPSSPATATAYARDRSFSCDGQFTIRVPSGTAVVHVEKGKEYFPVDVSVVVAEDAITRQTIRIERWIDMPRLGWYSATVQLDLVCVSCHATLQNWMEQFDVGPQPGVSRRLSRCCRGTAGGGIRQDRALRPAVGRFASLVAPRTVDE